MEIDDNLLAAILKTLTSHADFSNMDASYRKDAWDEKTGETHEVHDRCVIETLRALLQRKYPELCKKISQGWL